MEFMFPVDVCFLEPGVAEDTIEAFTSHPNVESTNALIEAFADGRSIGPFRGPGPRAPSIRPGAPPGKPTLQSNPTSLSSLLQTGLGRCTARCHHFHLSRVPTMPCPPRPLVPYRPNPLHRKPQALLLLTHAACTPACASSPQLVGA